jgi:hypothetical protein
VKPGTLSGSLPLHSNSPKGPQATEKPANSTAESRKPAKNERDEENGDDR